MIFDLLARSKSADFILKRLEAFAQNFSTLVARHALTNVRLSEDKPIGIDWLCLHAAFTDDALLSEAMLQISEPLPCIPLEDLLRLDVRGYSKYTLKNRKAKYAEILKRAKLSTFKEGIDPASMAQITKEDERRIILRKVQLASGTNLHLFDRLITALLKQTPETFEALLGHVQEHWLASIFEHSNIDDQELVNHVGALMPRLILIQKELSALYPANGIFERKAVREKEDDWLGGARKQGVRLAHVRALAQHCVGKEAVLAKVVLTVLRVEASEESTQLFASKLKPFLDKLANFPWVAHTSKALKKAIQSHLLGDRSVSQALESFLKDGGVVLCKDLSRAITADETLMALSGRIMKMALMPKSNKKAPIPSSNDSVDAQNEAEAEDVDKPKEKVSENLIRLMQDLMCAENGVLSSVLGSEHVKHLIGELLGQEGGKHDTSNAAIDEVKSALTQALSNLSVSGDLIPVIDGFLAKKVNWEAIKKLLQCQDERGQNWAATLCQNLGRSDALVQLVTDQINRRLNKSLKYLNRMFC